MQEGLDVGMGSHRVEEDKGQPHVLDGIHIAAGSLPGPAHEIEEPVAVEDVEFFFEDGIHRPEEGLRFFDVLAFGLERGARWATERADHTVPGPQRIDRELLGSLAGELAYGGNDNLLHGGMEGRAISGAVVKTTELLEPVVAVVVIACVEGDLVACGELLVKELLDALPVLQAAFRQLPEGSLAKLPVGFLQQRGTLLGGQGLAIDLDRDGSLDLHVFRIELGVLRLQARVFFPEELSSRLTPPVKEFVAGGEARAGGAGEVLAVEVVIELAVEGYHLALVGEEAVLDRLVDRVAGLGDIAPGIFSLDCRGELAPVPNEALKLFRGFNRSGQERVDQLPQAVEVGGIEVGRDEVQLRGAGVRFPGKLHALVLEVASVSPGPRKNRGLMTPVTRPLRKKWRAHQDSNLEPPVS